MTVASILNVEEARLRARRTLPRVLFEYIDRGTEDELRSGVTAARSTRSG